MKLTKEDYKNLQTLLTRVAYQGLDEARLAIVLDAKLTVAQQEVDGDANSTSADKSSPDKPTGD